MSHYMSPLRFHRIWEMDRNGYPMCGSLKEQMMVRAAIGSYVEWDGPYDRALFVLTKKVKATGRYFLPISLLHEEGRQSFWGRTGGAVIQLFPPDRELISQHEWDFVLSHEVGHVMGRYLFNPNDRTEAWATQFQNWVMYGQREGTYVYDRLDSVGAMDSVVVAS